MESQAIRRIAFRIVADDLAMIVDGGGLENNRRRRRQVQWNEDPRVEQERLAARHTVVPHDFPCLADGVQSKEPYVRPSRVRDDLICPMHIAERMVRVGIVRLYVAIKIPDDLSHVVDT